MVTLACGSCGQLPAAFLRRRAAERVPGRSVLPGAQVSAQPLCRECSGWLAGLIRRTLDADPSVAEVLGAPSSDGRLLVFDDQCALCREIAPPYNAMVVDVRVPGGGEIVAPFLACGSCDAWLHALAQDSRSARLEAHREIDGPYGRWPFPNLRSVRVQVDVEDEGVLAVIARSCRAMDVPISTLAGEVLLVEARGTGRAHERLKALGAGDHDAVVVMAPLSARNDLLACLPLATDWLTVPVTPQQVTAALGRVVRQPGLVRRFDPETALPLANLAFADRPALEVVPLRGTSRFEAAWLLRRFSRGYDEAGLADGRIVLLPRARVDDLHGVEARLARLLAGRCEVRPLLRPVEWQRFEAAG